MADDVRAFFEGLSARLDSSRVAGMRNSYAFDIDGAGEPGSGGPHGVVEIVICPHYQEHVLRREIALDRVPRIVVEVNALQVGYVAIAIGQQDLKRHAVDDRPVEIDGRERETQRPHQPGTLTTR